MKAETSFNQGMEGGANNVFDSDHDGTAELLYKTEFVSVGRTGLGYYEWVSPDSFAYVWGDTSLGNEELDPADLLPFAAGYLDGDSLTDLTGINGEVYHDSLYLLVCQHEARAFDCYPESLVWRDRFDTSEAWSGGRTCLTDLDRDGNHDLLFMSLWPRVLVYESNGDNSCKLVCRARSRVEAVPFFAIGDLDQDSLTEFAAGPLGPDEWVWFWECSGNDTYVMTDSISAHWPNAHDMWEGHDTDQDGKPEFFVAFARLTGGYWTMYLYQIEATGNNQHEMVFVDSAWCTSYDWERQSKCGDVDGDGIEEVVWSVGTSVYVYKATGPRQYQRVFSWQNVGSCFSDIAVYDINNDGYKEVIVSGHYDGGGSRTRVFGLEAAKVVYPNGGEALTPGDTVQIQWRRYEPPRCESASVLLSTDNGRIWQPIASGLAPDDSILSWVVPRQPSDSCLVKVIVYGPGWRADHSDGVFRILPVGLEEQPGRPDFSPALTASPSPAFGSTAFSYRVPVTTGARFGVFDATGRQVADLSPVLARGSGRIRWDCRDGRGRRLSAGVYVARLVFGTKSIQCKVVVR